MLRKEMAEKYCSEFCTWMPMDWQKFDMESLFDTKENDWKQGKCVDVCMQSSPRCHTTTKCMDSAWFGDSDTQLSNGVIN